MIRLVRRRGKEGFPRGFGGELVIRPVRGKGKEGVSESVSRYKF